MPHSTTATSDMFNFFNLLTCCLFSPIARNTVQKGFFLPGAFFPHWGRFFHKGALFSQLGLFFHNWGRIFHKWRADFPLSSGGVFSTNGAIFPQRGSFFTNWGRFFHKMEGHIFHFFKSEKNALCGKNAPGRKIGL